MKQPGRYGFRFRQTRRNRRDRAQGELDLRRTEIGLLRRQSVVAIANVVATVALTATLALVAWLQWRTSESTAAIERAKARPHFSIRQENQADELGFLPRRFAIQPDAGVSDTSEAFVTSVMLIHYRSQSLGLSGICRAAFLNFYGWTNNAVSFEINDAATRLINTSRQPDHFSDSYIRLQPLWLVINVSFNDLFGVPGRQYLMVRAGQLESLSPGAAAENSSAGMTVFLQVDGQGKPVIFGSGFGANPVAPVCAEALRAMRQIQWLRVARDGEMPQDTDIPFVTEPARNSNP
jgi:hypothetical protein